MELTLHSFMLPLVTGDDHHQCQAEDKAEMAASIGISPRAVIILVDEGQTTGTATVKFRSPDFVPVIWEKWLGGRWERRVVTLYSDEYEIELGVGQVYEVLLYDQGGGDPNASIDDPVPPIDRSVVAGVSKRTETNFSENEEKSAGGTYVAWFPTNNAGRRFRAVMDIGRTAPNVTKEGVDYVPNPMAVLSSDFATSHILWFGSNDIIPETEYWAALLLIGEDGGWQSETYKFKTQKRDVEIILRRVHIVNDGSDGTNEASFRFWVLNGTTFAEACALGETTIWDKGADHDQPDLEYLGLGGSCNVPMHVYSQEGATERGKVVVLTRGIASAFGKDDASGNFRPSNDFPDNPPFFEDIWPDAFLYLPVARTRDQDEELEDVYFETLAIPQNNPDSNEFEYTVEGRYSVTYS